MKLSGTGVFGEMLDSSSTFSEENVMKHYLLDSPSIRKSINGTMIEEVMLSKAHGLLILALQLHLSSERLSKFLTLEQCLLHLNISSLYSTEL
jgi:hypothetical protein